MVLPMQSGAVNGNIAIICHACLGIFSGGIRKSGLEVLSKGALMVLPMQWGAVKGSTQAVSQDSSCGASQQSTGYNEMSHS